MGLWVSKKQTPGTPLQKKGPSWELFVYVCVRYEAPNPAREKEPVSFFLFFLFV